MPNRIKHSPETRKRIYDLFWDGRDTTLVDRDNRGRFTRIGKNPVGYIEKVTGVPRSTIYKIATGRL